MAISRPSVIQNFKLGLDSRRSVLTSQAGSLIQLNNAHVNQGAEIEQRKAFSQLASSLPRGVALANGETLNAYGLVATPSGLFCFGSADATQNTVATSAPYVFPPGVTYQRLQHPLRTLVGITGTVTWTAIPEMTSVVIAKAFGGFPFVVASFGTGQMTEGNAVGNVQAQTFIFWQGVALWQQYSGINMMTDAGINHLTPPILAQVFFDNFVNYFPASSGYTASYAGILFGTTVSITGPAGVPFALTVSDTDGLSGGHLTTTTTQAAQGAVAGVSGTFSFYVVSGSSGQVTTITPAGGSDLLNGTPVPYSTSLLVTAQNIAAQINASTGSNGGYTAVGQAVPGIANISQVIVTAPVGSSFNTITSAIVVTSTLHVNNKPSTSGSVTAGTLTSNAITGGIDPTAGLPQISTLTWTNTPWTVGSTYTVILTANNISYTLGFGNIGGIVPVALLALGNKQYLAAGSTFYFSKINDAFRWEQQDTGAGLVQVSDMDNAPTNILGLGVYQGRLAVYGRWNTQIYAVNANPVLYQQLQNFQNIGTLSGLSVQAIGDLDDYFLSDSGVRSLRVRDASSNAFVADVGSSIDTLILEAFIIAGSAATAGATACSTVDPSQQRYWLSLENVIYVLAYYPTLKISAWSTYSPSYIPIGNVTITITADVLQGANLTVIGYWGTPGASGPIFTTGFINSNLTLAQFATLIVTSVNNRTGTTGWTASAIGGVVTLVPPAGIISCNLCFQVAQGVAFTTTANTQTGFTPQVFAVFAGQIYALDTTGHIYQYGGNTNNLYDGCPVTVQTPWLDNRQMPVSKQCLQIDWVWSGLWILQAGTDPISGTLETIVDTGNAASPNPQADSAFDKGQFSYLSRGTHYQFLAVSDTSNFGQVMLGALVMLAEPEYFE